MAFAKAKMMPIEAPNSGPSEREIIKYVPPPLIWPFVLIADMDKAVNDVTAVAKRTIKIAWPIPASATTHERRKNSITPQIFNMHLIQTPWIQPNLNPDANSPVDPFYT